ncbi:multidrug effflux MFS transporter [Vibrio parahaemolyticus]|uniref:multidrug effflux MFS transporter n=1 Tax=Vibrio parahaemolyticus TaxID=670 RepID=UPI0015B9D8E8|nr:multidrug effflux MFS transporter [Vibrio parahaemolyticus]MBE4323567.1 multidrug effflux MFS transporter [Vibrio parahaemolyticus]QLE25540.1 multidrug effflux MFS transporter [Vibrio parahaemolyticus]HCE1879845.1 multidrug effflux MFS transporter [Vibrio parahaemolyticus]HCE1882961.1 multidrug effflux MFS transporter [Vibrio parahaemolyticus]HCE3644521.1 multidrug effflux MFS transporter [Vibrio parahaemolyticus]
MNRPINFRTILLACLIISVGQLSMGLVMPSLPWIAKDFSVSLDQAQLLVSIYLLGFGPSQFIYGPMSDALGRKKVLLAGLLIAMSGLLMIIFWSHTFTGMVLGRFLQGLGTGCCAVLARASTRDQFSGNELPVAMSYIAMAASITPLIAPVIGGFINFHFGWSMVFISLLGYVSLAWIIIAFRFKETITRRSAIPSPAKMLVQYRDLLLSRYFMSFASISWLNFSLMITTVSVMPFIMQDQIGMTSDEYAMWALIPALGMLGGTTICNRIRPVIGNKKMLLCTPVLHISAALWLFFCPVEPLYLMIGQLLMILGNGIALPCAQALVMQPYKEQAGAAAAMSGGGQMVVSSLVSMTLVQLGLSEAWHLSLVVVLFTAITLTNILRGFNTEEAHQQREAAEKAS